MVGEGLLSGTGGGTKLLHPSAKGVATIDWLLGVDVVDDNEVVVEDNRLEAAAASSSAKSASAKLGSNSAYWESRSRRI